MIDLSDKEIEKLVDAVAILRTISQWHEDKYQRSRDSTNPITLSKGRMAMEKAVQLSRMANEINMVASTKGNL